MWPQPWGEQMHITRVDVCCDLSITTHNGMPQKFTQEHRALFTYRGSGNDVFKRHECETLYINSRESPVTLRIYKKSELCDRHDKAVWSANGWKGEDVWRVEYEYHNRPNRPVLEDGFTCPGGIPSLWSDGLARVRMCSVPPRTCSQQNKAPTHPWWLALGTAARHTRRRGELTAVAKTARERAVASLKRLVDKNDPELLAVFAAHIGRMQRLHFGKVLPGTAQENKHGEGQG